MLSCIDWTQLDRSSWLLADILQTKIFEINYDQKQVRIMYMSLKMGFFIETESEIWSGFDFLGSVGIMNLTIFFLFAKVSRFSHIQIF